MELPPTAPQTGCTEWPAECGNFFFLCYYSLRAALGPIMSCGPLFRRRIGLPLQEHWWRGWTGSIGFRLLGDLHLAPFFKDGGFDEEGGEGGLAGNQRGSNMRNSMISVKLSFYYYDRGKGCMVFGYLFFIHGKLCDHFTWESEYHLILTGNFINVILLQFSIRRFDVTVTPK